MVQKGSLGWDLEGCGPQAFWGARAGRTPEIQARGEAEGSGVLHGHEQSNRGRCGPDSPRWPSTPRRGGIYLPQALWSLGGKRAPVSWGQKELDGSREAARAGQGALGPGCTSAEGANCGGKASGHRLGP